MDRFMEHLASPEGGLLIWGLYTRLLGLTFFVALIALTTQLNVLHGTKGLTPLAPQLRSHARNFGVAKALWYYPTLFWLNCSDWALFQLPLAGAIAGLCALLGGPQSPLCLLVAWACLLSVDASGAGVTGYPWDVLLLETGFLSLWLPATQPLPIHADTLLRDPAAWLAQLPGMVSELFSAHSLSATALPPPLLSFSLRYALFRIMIGFGRIKFARSGWRDRLYIKSFIVNQPIPSPFASLAHWMLPDAAWVGLLLGMAIVELPVPFLLFFQGWPRVIAGLSIAGLQAGIQATGTFGYFNLLTAVLSLVALTPAETLSFTWRDVFPAPTGSLPNHNSPAAQHPWHVAFALLFLCYILPLSLFQLGMNSWVNAAWHQWTGLTRVRVPWGLRWAQSYIKLLRESHQFRIVSAYGVFPPGCFPAQRWTLAYEGSADGATWQRYHFRFCPSTPKSAPQFCAPWHSRIDQAIIYEAIGSNGSIVSNVTANQPAVVLASTNSWTRLVLRLLEGGDTPRMFSNVFRHNPFPHPSQPPRYVRIQLVHFVPTSFQRWWATGDYWIETPMGFHYPAVSLESLAAQARLPDLSGGKAEPPPTALLDSWPMSDSWTTPEEWFCDSVTWRARAGLSSAGVTSEEEEEAWGFIAALRAAAAEEAATLAEGQGAAPGGGGAKASAAAVATRHAPLPDFPASSAPRRRASSRSRPDPPPSLSPSSRVTSAPHLQPQQQPLSSRLSGLEIANATNVRLPLDPVSLLKGALEVRRVGSKGQLSSHAANACFIWTALPGVMSRLSGAYTAAQIVRIRTTLARMAGPLMRAAERVCNRVTPTRAQLMGEFAAACGGDSSGAELYTGGLLSCLTAPEASQWVDVTAQLGLAAGLPLLTDPPSTGGMPPIPICYFSGNDDAHQPQGSMSTPLKWLAHAHRILLFGGPGVYRRVLSQLTGDPSVGPHPVPLSSGAPSGDHLGRLPLPAVWNALTLGGTLLPSDVGTEAGTFLLSACAQDSLAQLAIMSRRASYMARQGHFPQRDGPPLAFAPPALFLMRRTLAHPALQRLHVPHAAPEAMAPGELLPGGFLAAPRGVHWANSSCDSPHWLFRGFEEVQQ